MTEQRVVARNITMYPEDWQVVDDAGKKIGLSTSTALRVIVRQWAQNFQTAIQRPAPVTESDADMDTRAQAQLASLAATNAGLR